MERISFNDAPQGLYGVLMKVQEYVNKSGLDFKLQELVKIHVSQMNGCAYCIDMHSKDAAHAGETLQRLISVGVWREVSYYSDKEKAALELAERLTTLTPADEMDDIHSRLSAHFSKQEIAHLTLAIAQINTWNRIAKSFGAVPGSYQVQQHVVAN